MRSLFLFVFIGGVVLMALNVAKVSDAASQPKAHYALARSSELPVFQSGAARNTRLMEEYRRSGMIPQR
jgi:hypothetical protein